MKLPEGCIQHGNQGSMAFHLLGLVLVAYYVLHLVLWSVLLSFS